MINGSIVRLCGIALIVWALVFSTTCCILIWKTYNQAYAKGYTDACMQMDMIYNTSFNICAK